MDVTVEESVLVEIDEAAAAAAAEGSAEKGDGGGGGAGGGGAGGGGGASRFPTSKGLVDFKTFNTNSFQKVKEHGRVKYESRIGSCTSS